MVNSHDDYVSFLLKLRRVRGESADVWTVTLQDTRTQTVLTFSNLQTLLRFLSTTFGADVVYQPDS